jgi:pimeloyl-ACP methyl ester carboxylesterase
VNPFGANAVAPPVWRTGTVRAAGATLATFEAGNTAPNARTLLLLHGLGHWSDAAWGRLVPHLDPSMRFVAFDLPGFGASDKPDAAYDLAFFRAAIDDAVSALGLQRFALAGHSLGGFLAADYAGRAPHRVEHLALIAPAAFARTPRFVVYGIAAGIARRLFTRRPPRRFVTRVLNRAVADVRNLDDSTMQRAHELAGDAAYRRAFAGVYSGALRTFANARALHAGFARYPGPVLCAWGRHDRYIPVSALRAVRRVYPHAQTLVLERSAHLPMIEESEQLGAALREFFASDRERSRVNEVSDDLFGENHRSSDSR